MAEDANTRTLLTDTSKAPYYDDYETHARQQGYYKWLFKPSFGLQGRDLNSIQSALQDQINRFGRHIFREGSIVIPGQFDLRNVDYVKVNDIDASNNLINIENFEGEVLTGNTTGIKATVIKVADGSEANTNTKTVYVSYMSSASDNETKVFANNEVLHCSAGTLVTRSDDATGLGSIFSINEGVFFAKNHFISFDTQSIILERYNTNPSCRVGFYIQEEIVNYLADQTLLDPALESSNYQAPGSDRLKITATLVKVDLDEPLAPPNYTELFSIKNGVIQTIQERPQYAIIQDEIAKRTYDESGDYFVRGMNVRIREHLNTGENGGLYTALEGGDSNKLAIGIEPGLAYVKGYEIGPLVTKWIETPKANTYQNVNSQIVSAHLGTSVQVKEIVGVWPHDQGISIDLYDTAQTRISSRKWSVGAQTGSKIGSAKLKALEYYDGILGTANGEATLYLTDIEMLGSNTFASVRSVYSSGTSPALGADVVLYDGKALLEGKNNNILLLPLQTNAVRTVRDTSGNPDTTFTFKRTDPDIVIATNGTFTITVASLNEGFPYFGTLSESEKEEITLTINEDKEIPLTGWTITGANGGATITGGGSANFNNLNIGDKITIAGHDNPYFITTIAGGTSANVTPNLTRPASGNTVTKTYKAGDIIDLNSKSATTGSKRVVVGDSSSSMSFFLGEDFGAPTSGGITYRLSRSSAREIKKQLRSDRFVIIDCASAGVTGPFNLGFSDVWRIKEIRKSTSAFTANTDGVDVTSSFNFNNGQKDDFYDHATISPKPSAGLTTADKLLVRLDYFAPDYTNGLGYFSVDSYPIDDTQVTDTSIQTEDIPLFRSPTTNALYDLRNYLDFRPVMQSTANDSTTVAGASSNPPASTTFNMGTLGLRLPAPDSQVIFDYSYYLPRKDVVVVDRYGNYSIIQGIPTPVPITPLVPDNLMALATLTISPYPSIAPSYAQQIERMDLASKATRQAQIRFTMKDIGALKKRIENIEYYLKLDALEKAAVDFTILDENGLDRFKNGIFVDSFIDHSLGATYNPDYSIVVDPEEKAIRPKYRMDSIDYRLHSNTNTVLTGDWITLPFSEVTFIEHLHATTIRNVESSIFRYDGNLYLNPEVDNWVDTHTLADEQVQIGSNQTASEAGTLATTWGAWQTTSTGVFRIWNESRTKVLATFDNYDAAVRESEILSAPKHWHENSIGWTGGAIGNWVESVYEQNRVGQEIYTETITSQERLGERVVDVSLKAYIRPQYIQLSAFGMKANTRYYTFFDGEKMSDYVTPTDSNFNPIGAEGSKLVSTADGSVYCLLRLPNDDSKRFRVGNKEVKLSDVPTYNDVATSSATAYFLAQGLTQTKQGTVITTRWVINRTQELTQTQTVTTDWRWNDRNSCMAYSFMVRAPEDEDGIFITSIDMFVQAKDPNLGLWVEIREMDNAGGITTKQVPLSEVYIDSDDVNVSDDASAVTKVRFPVPIFLQNNTQYAFVIHTEGINPNYYFWVSRIGEPDVSTGTQVTTRALTGTLYTTNNNLNFDIVPDMDLKLRINRASFVTGVTGEFVLTNKPIEILQLSEVSEPLTYYGENMGGYDQLTFSSVTPGSVNVGDIIVTANANGAVQHIANSTYLVGNSMFKMGESANVYNSSMVYKQTLTIATRANSQGKIVSYLNSSGNLTMRMVDSNGLFVANDVLRGAFSNSTAKISGMRTMPYDVIDFEPATLQFNKTYLNWFIRGTSNTGVVASNYTPINPNDNFYFYEGQAVYPYTLEKNLLANSRSHLMKGVMSTQSEYMSPVVDLARTHSVFVHNLVNDDDTEENLPSGGRLINKYISRTVTLAEGQDAEDLLLVLTAYHPPTTHIKVWGKFCHAEDAEPFASKPWVPLENLAEGTFSSKTNRMDYKEFTFRIPQELTYNILKFSSMTGGNVAAGHRLLGVTSNVYANVTGVFGSSYYMDYQRENGGNTSYIIGETANVRNSTGHVVGINATIGSVGKTMYRPGEFDPATYTTDSGQQFTGFKQFAIKIGLYAEDSAIVPRVADLRVIALQM